MARRRTQAADGQPPAELFGGPVRWERDAAVLEVAAGRSLASVVRRMQLEQAAWVVVVRAVAGGEDVYYYVFRSAEIERLFHDLPDRQTWPIGRALDVHEWMSSRRALGGRPAGPAQGQFGPAAARIVDFDAGGRIVAIGEREDMIPHAAAVDRGAGGAAGAGGDVGFDLGPMRGGAG
ncbi:MAG TPA: TCAD7 domain-containing protein, partial [Pelomicrobium sp.]|nr:TCAD7 domain-containing protein [Pelomicrobium sp.]